MAERSRQSQSSHFLGVTNTLKPQKFDAPVTSARDGTSWTPLDATRTGREDGGRGVREEKTTCVVPRLGRVLYLSCLNKY